MKVSIIGAGSMFTRHLTVDILTIDGLDEGTFALVDIDPRRLELARKLVEMLIAKMGKNWKVIASTDRREVIADSDFVINQIEVSGLQTVRWDYEIPLKYGVKQCIGDTLGPGGLFKTLRTLPPWIEIVRDIEELAPNTTILNYTNPMSAVILATTRVTDLPVVGLCHSVQGTSRLLADMLGVPYEELKWECAGINHMAWFTKLEHKGRDMYPILRREPKTLSSFVTRCASTPCSISGPLSPNPAATSPSTSPTTANGRSSSTSTVDPGTTARRAFTPTTGQPGGRTTTGRRAARLRRKGAHLDRATSTLR